VHRLLARLEVDDLEPAVREAGVPAVVQPRALAVGAAVREQAVHELEPGRERLDRLRIEVEYDSDPAHAPTAACRERGAASLAAATAGTAPGDDTAPMSAAGRRVALISGHYLGSKRRAGFHHLASAYWNLGWDVTFVTAAISHLSRLKGDYRFAYPVREEANRLVGVKERLTSYVLL